jgi:hypothetical protein
VILAAAAMGLLGCCNTPSTATAWWALEGVCCVCPSTARRSAWLSREGPRRSTVRASGSRVHRGSVRASARRRRTEASSGGDTWGGWLWCVGEGGGRGVVSDMSGIGMDRRVCQTTVPHNKTSHHHHHHLHPPIRPLRTSMRASRQSARALRRSLNPRTARARCSSG